MNKYRVFLIYPDKHTGYGEVKGYPLSMPELNGVNIFAHHPYIESPAEYMPYWNISEVKTGVALITYCEGTKQ